MDGQTQRTLVARVLETLAAVMGDGLQMACRSGYCARNQAKSPGPAMPAAIMARRSRLWPVRGCPPLPADSQWLAIAAGASCTTASWLVRSMTQPWLGPAPARVTKQGAASGVATRRALASS